MSVGHSFAYVADLTFLRYVWNQTQRAAVESRRATNLATHLKKVWDFFIPGQTTRYFLKVQQLSFYLSELKNL